MTFERGDLVVHESANARGFVTRQTGYFHEVCELDEHPKLALVRVHEVYVYHPIEPSDGRIIGNTEPRLECFELEELRPAR